MLTGKRLAHYEVLEKVGAGGMGEVYRAHDTTLGRDVALKVLPPEVARDAEARRRFEQEAKAVAALQHPNIVTLHSIEEADGVHFLTMELVEGKTLDRSIPRDGFPTRRVLEIGIPLADGLAAAHQANVIHHDLKPANIMSTSGRIRILDFGLAELRAPSRSVDPDETVTTSRAIRDAAGTIPYMAPEVLRGEPSDHRADLFALGAILFELITASRPFAGSSPATLTSSILRDEPPSLLEKRPDVPADLERIVRRCLRKDPERRFQTAQDVRNELEDLRALLEHEGTGSTRALGAARSATMPVELPFKLSADLVRQLSGRRPSMIGDTMTYLDNNVESDVLAIYLHGIGLDQHHFEPILMGSPWRGVAPTLYGFGRDVASREPLSLPDHSTLLRALFGEFQARFQPEIVVLVGFSAGADQIMQMLTSSEGVGMDVDGALFLGCNLDQNTTFMSRFFATFQVDDRSETLPQLGTLGAQCTTLSDWISLHEYLVYMLSKLGSDVASVKRYAADIAAPFKASRDSPFPALYRAAVTQLGLARFVFSDAEARSLDAVLSQHLERSVLGDQYSEDTIVLEPVGHMQLTDPALMLRHLNEMIDALRHR